MNNPDFILKASGFSCRPQGGGGPASSGQKYGWLEKKAAGSSTPTPSLEPYGPVEKSPHRMEVNWGEGSPRAGGGGICWLTPSKPLGRSPSLPSPVKGEGPAHQLAGIQPAAFSPALGPLPDQPPFRVFKSGSEGGMKGEFLAAAEAGPSPRPPPPLFRNERVSYAFRKAVCGDKH